MLQEPSLEGAFLGVTREGEEFKGVRVLQGLPGEVGLQGGRVFSKFVWALPWRL